MVQAQRDHPALALLPEGAHFGADRIESLRELLGRVGARRPLLVTDPGLAAAGLVDRLLERGRTAGAAVSVFSAVAAHPSVADVERGIDTYRRGAHDVVIALGGGSVLDVGKSLAFAVRQDTPLLGFGLDLRGRGGDREPPAEAGAPWIAMPTTAGSGSELSPSAVLTDPATGRKRSLAHSRMRTPHVICDPCLTLGLPPHLTAWTGMDALVHNLEAYLAPVADGAADRCALEGLRCAGRSLARTVEDGDDLEGRTDMVAASTLGALAFAKGLGGVHAMGHALSARFGTAHGLVNAVLLPYVLELNATAAGDRLGDVADALRLGARSAGAVLGWTLRRRARLGIPPTLADVGIAWNAGELDQLCTATLADANAATNPVALDRHRVAKTLTRARYGTLTRGEPA